MIRRRILVHQRFDVDVDAVTQRRKLEYQSHSSESHQRTPEILQPQIVVDVADVSEAIRCPRQFERKYQSNSWDRPTAD